MTDNSKIQTLSDFVRYGKVSSYSVPNVSLLIKNGNLVQLDQLAYAKYDNLLMNNSYIIDLSIEEYNRFRLNPKLLSTYLYGTPNLYHLILYLNRCSEFEFDMQRIRLLKKSDVNQLFKLILAHEDENIKKSKQNIKG